MKHKFLLLFLTGTIFCTDLLAATVTSNATGGGAWSVGATWAGGIAPVNGDNVIIAAGDAVNVDITRTCNWIEIYGTLTIDATFTLTVIGCDAGSAFGQNFTIDGASPGTLINNGTFVLDQGACGGTPSYEDQAGGTFTNNSIFTIDNGGDYIENGAFANAGTINVTSTSGTSFFENYVNANNTGGTINVNASSTLINGSSFAAGNGTININAGGIYQHAQNGGTIPTCTWNVTSTCHITGTTNAVPAGLVQTFGNFTWDCSQTTTNLNLVGALTTINGNFTLAETGSPSKTLQFATTTSPTINIGGDFIIAANGTDAIQFSTTGSPTVNVTGNVLLSAGKIIMGTSGNPVFNVTGNYVHSATTAGNTLQMSGGSGTGTLNLTGNFDYSSTTASLITETSTGSGIINFVGDVSHTFNTATTTPFANTIQVIVTANDVLDMSASTASLAFTGASQLMTINGTLITGTRTITMPASTSFTLGSAATLNTTNASGVSATSAGTIQGAGTKTFDNAANYILGGASTTTGFTDNTTMNNLTLTASAALGTLITVNGTLLNSTGTFTTGGFAVTASTLTNNATITAGASVFIVSLDFTNGGTFTANTSTLNIGGNFSNGGTFTANTGTVVFNGTSGQTIGGASTTTFYNITSSNTCIACGVSLAQHANLIGVLTINSRTFTTTSYNFTLISDASGTASIAAITAAGADFIGDIIMQRYTGSGPTDWRFLSSAVSGTTIADWADDFATSGFTGATCSPTDCADPMCSLVCNYPSIYWYDESTSGDVDQGYTAVGNVTDALLAGAGYWVYLGNNPITFEVTGPPNKFSESLAVTYFDNFSSDDDGWNLVANPYPSAIDWDDADWTKTSLEDAIYIYNSTTGTYAYHCPVDSSPINGNGGSQYIASQQAFWVKATTDAPAPVLTAVEGVKAATQNPTYLKTVHSPNTSYYPSAFKDFPVPLNTNSTQGRLKLTANGNGYDDEIFVHFKQNATNNFDGKYDAWKLIHPNAAAHNFSSVLNDSVDLSVNGLPPLSANVSIPIRLTVPSTGVYKISRDSTLMLPLSSCIILEDKLTSTMVDLRTTVSYSFTMADTTAAPRFILHVYAPIAKKAINATCSSSNNGMAIATGIGTGPWNYVWKNSSGTVLKTTTGSTTADTLFNLASGTYSVIVNGATCGTVGDTIIVKAPAALANIPSSTNVSCYGENDGSASVVVSGGTLPYSYLWSNGQSSSAASNLISGNYSVTTTDGNGCSAVTTVNITQPALLTAGYTASSYTVDVNNSVTFTNTSSGASSYLWNFGDNSATSIAVSPTHIYMQTGTYTVTLVSSDGVCSDSVTSTVYVNSTPTALNESNSSSGISVVYDKGEVFLLFSLETGTQVNIAVYNMIGEQVFSKNNLFVKNSKIKLDLPSSSIGIYIAVSEMENAVVSKKVVFPIPAR